MVLLVGVALMGPTATARGEESVPAKPASPVQASVRLSDRILLRGQDVEVELTLRNISDAPLSLYRDIQPTLGMPGEVRFLVRRPDGTSVEIAQPVDEHSLPSPEAYRRLSPGDSITQAVMMRLERGGGRFDALEPGRYDVALEVSFSDEGRRAGVPDAWAGTVLTDPIHIEVVEAGD